QTLERDVVSGCRWVNAAQPRVGLAPKNIAASRNVQPAVEEHGHAIDVARAFLPVPQVRVDVLLWRARVEVELPDFFERPNRTTRLHVRRQQLESIHHAVATAEEERVAVPHSANAWRGP